MVRADGEQRLISKARRRAFDTYLRFGHKIDPLATTDGEHKEVGLGQEPVVAKTRFYVWRTVGDDRVRPKHEAREGRIFARNDPPDGGPPGTERNCRCWAESYFGDPGIADELQPLRHVRQVAVTGTELWSSIESLSRPGGSLAESFVALRDGTRIQSKFWRTLVSRTIALAGGGKVRIDREAGRQQVYLGNESEPLFRSAWTLGGPRVTHAQRRMAFMGDADTLLEPDFRPDRVDPFRDPNPQILSPNPMLDLFGAGGGLDLLGAAFLALHMAQQEAPASQGMAEDERSVISFRAWSASGERNALPLLVDSLTEERLRQSCKYLPDAQRWTDEAAQLLSQERWTMSAQTWGTKVHLAVKNMVEDLRKNSAEADKILRAELSMTIDEERVPYGTSGSTRLDILEDRKGDMGAVCVYDIKTSNYGLTAARVKKIADLVREHFDAKMFFVIELRPSR